MSTEKGVQMPNAGFEEWGTFDVVCPYSSEDKAFWAQEIKEPACFSDIDRQIS